MATRGGDSSGPASAGPARFRARRRVALLWASAAQGDRIRVQGEVVDVPVADLGRADDFDPAAAVPGSQLETLRPIQDLLMLRVYGARLRLQVLSGGTERGARVVHASGEFSVPDRGFFDVPLRTDLPPGRYAVRAVLRGVGSWWQRLSDAALDPLLAAPVFPAVGPVGVCPLYVLPRGQRPIVITSDIDQTLLETPLDSARGLLGTAFAPALSRPAIPGMPELYRQLGQSSSVAALSFVSSSPQFFRRSLMAAVARFGVPHAGLHLRYVMGPIRSLVRTAITSLLYVDEHLARGFTPAVDEVVKLLSSTAWSLVDSIAHKLTTLLGNRLVQPTDAREILIGDNAEADYLIFTLYQALLTGSLERPEQYLYRLRFRDREAITWQQARRIARLAEESLGRHGRVNPVREVWINLASDWPGSAEMLQRVRRVLPRGLLDDRRIVRPVASHGAIGMSVLALDRGLIGRAQAFEVLQAIAARGVSLRVETARRAIKQYHLERYSPEELLAVLEVSGLLS